MEHKFEVAKKVIEIISFNNGFVYGNFVKDVIVPRMNDPKCEISFDTINIWCRSSTSRDLVIEKLMKSFYYERSSGDYLTHLKILDGCEKLLFHVYMIVCPDYQNRNFDVNFVEFRYSKGTFECIAFDNLIDKIKNKQTTMIETYNPTENVEFERINKDFFQKGWTISSKKQQPLFEKWIVENDVSILISYENEYWNYRPVIKQNDFKFEIAKKVIEIVSANNGCVYGNFVKDVIVPRMNDPKCEISFDSIDIWFRDLFNRGDTISKLLIEFKEKFEIISNGQLTKYEICDDNDKLLFTINMRADEIRKVRIFDVDLVEFKCSKGEFKCIAFEHLVDKIKNKRVNIATGYILSEDQHFEKLNNEFLLKGWTISSKEQQPLFEKWIVKNNISVLISYGDGYWNYLPSTKQNDTKYKFELAKKILSLAFNNNGEVYGGFVRDVIVPSLNDPNCNNSFKDLDIWFRDEKFSTLFVNALEYNFKVQKSSYGSEDLDYSKYFSNDFRGYKFSRKQYHIYSENEKKFLFHVDVITSDNLPVNDFNVNAVTYKYINSKFERCINFHCDTQIIIDNYIVNKIAFMVRDYNPEGFRYYERINRIFFSKGWIVRCIYKHDRLSEFIKSRELNIEEIYNGTFYDYVPNVPSKKDIYKVKLIDNPNVVKLNNKIVDDSTVFKFDPDIKNRIKVHPFPTVFPNWNDKSASDESNDKIKFDSDAKKEIKLEFDSNAKKEIKLVFDSIDQEKRKKWLTGWVDDNSNSDKIKLADKIIDTLIDKSKSDNKLKLANTLTETLKNKLKLSLKHYNIKERAKNHFFVRFNGTRLLKHYLSGAERSWSNSSSDRNKMIFVLPLRICGTPEEIMKFLQFSESSYTEIQIDKFLKHAITKDNYKTSKRTEYEIEISSFWKRKKQFRDKLDGKLVENFYVLPQRICGTSEEIEKVINLSGYTESVKQPIEIKQKESANYLQKLDDKSKDIMMSVFGTGLEKLEEMLCNNIKDEELQNIYRLGLDEYHNKFNTILEKL